MKSKTELQRYKIFAYLESFQNIAFISIKYRIESSLINIFFRTHKCKVGIPPDGIEKLSAILFGLYYLA